MQFVDSADGGDAVVVDLLHKAAVAGVDEVDRMQGDSVEVIADVATDDCQAFRSVLGVPFCFERRDVAVEVVAVHNLPARLRQIGAQIVPHPNAIV